MSKSLLKGVQNPFFYLITTMKKYRNLILIVLAILLPAGSLLLIFLRKNKTITLTGQPVNLEKNIRPINNPLNIRSVKSNQWQGETTSVHGQGFEQFDTMESGLRAALINIRTYLKRGINTPKAIISTWAPESENPTNNYISFVCAKGGLKPDQKLTFSNADMKKLLIPMSRFEQGKDVITEDMFNKVFGKLTV